MAIKHTSNVTAITEVRTVSFGWCSMCIIFLQILLILITWGLSVIIFHSMCIFSVYSMALYRTTLQFYLCMHVSFLCRYVAPPGECYCNTVLCCDYFLSSSVVSRAFSVLCVYSKFRHHPHPLGYLCAKFHFVCGLHCWASLWGKIAYSIIQLIWWPGNRSLCFVKSTTFKDENIY